MLISNNIKSSGTTGSQFLEVSAPGATITYDGDFMIVTFNSSGVLSVLNAGPGFIDELLLVGGGNSPGAGGEVLSQSGFSISEQDYPVTIGNAGQDTTFSSLAAEGGGGAPGGAGGSGYGGSGSSGANGTTSSITGIPTTYGGGGGGGGAFGGGGGAGGAGGGGNGGSGSGATGGNGGNGTNNLGGGGGGAGAGQEQSGNPGVGGKGVAIFRIKFQ